MDHELSVRAVVLLKPGTLPKTSSGKIQRRECRARFLREQLDPLHVWRGDDTALRQETAAAPIGPQAAAPHRGAIEDWLMDNLAAHFAIARSEIRADDNFARYGLDSMAAVMLSEQLQTRLGRDVSPSVVYDTPRSRRWLITAPDTAGGRPLATERSRSLEEPIAIVGLSCRLPGARDAAAFWELPRLAATGSPSRLRLGTVISTCIFRREATADRTSAGAAARSDR